MDRFSDACIFIGTVHTAAATALHLLSVWQDWRLPTWSECSEDCRTVIESHCKPVLPESETWTINAFCGILFYLALGGLQSYFDMQPRKRRQVLLLVWSVITWCVTAGLLYGFVPLARVERRNVSAWSRARFTLVSDPTCQWVLAHDDPLLPAFQAQAAVTPADDRGFLLRATLAYHHRIVWSPWGTSWIRMTSYSLLLWMAVSACLWAVGATPQQVDMRPAPVLPLVAPVEESKCDSSE